MGRAALFVVTAVFIAAGVFLFNTQRKSLAATNEQSLYQEEMLAQQTARAGLTMAKSKIVRDFDNWSGGAFNTVPYQGGDFKVDLAGTPPGPAGPVKVTATGSYGDYRHRAKMTLARLQQLEAPLLFDVDTLSFLSGGDVEVWLEDTRPLSSMALEGLSETRRGNGPGHSSTARAVAYSDFAVTELQPFFAETAAMAGLRAKMEALYGQARFSPAKTSLTGPSADYVSGTFGTPGSPTVVLVRPDSGAIATLAAEGYGMLVVEGNVEMTTGFHWEGVVLVQADTTRNLWATMTGDARIDGALVIHHPNSRQPGGALANFPPNTAWGVDDEGGKLRYFSLSDSGNTGTMTTVGDLLNVNDAPNGERDIEALTIAGDGDLYFTNVENLSTLYKINPNAIDPENPGPVGASLVGTITDTNGLALGSGARRISSLQFVEETLYGMTNSTGEVFTIDTQTAEATLVGIINVPAFTTDGMAMLDGVMYLTRTGVNPHYATSYENPSPVPSELWRFDDFPNDLTLSQVGVMGNTGKVEALAAHPNGFLYSADDFHWYKIDPLSGQATTIASHGGEIDMEGIDFYFPAEEGSHSGGVNVGVSEGRKITQVTLQDDVRIYYSTEAIGKLVVGALGLDVLVPGAWISDFDHVGTTRK